VSKPLRCAGTAHSKNETEAVKRFGFGLGSKVNARDTVDAQDGDEEEEWIRSVKSNVVRHGVSS